MNYDPFENLKVRKKKSLDVEVFFRDNKDKQELTLLNPEITIHQKITSEDVNRPGLALTGFMDIYSNERIQVIGNTEHSYLESIGAENRDKIFKRLFSRPSPLWVVANGLDVPIELLEIAKSDNIPLMITDKPTTQFINEVEEYLESWFSPYASVHGSFIEVHGVGILYTGVSNVGKSECVLDLIERGHRFVADDSVRLSRKGKSIIGRRDHILTTHMEIRGLGVLDIKTMFGAHAVRKTREVDVIVELEEWRADRRYDRIGLDTQYQEIFDCKVRKILIPVSPGRNLATISEVIALEALVRIEDNINMASEFNKSLIEKIAASSMKKSPGNF